MAAYDIVANCALAGNSSATTSTAAGGRRELAIQSPSEALYGAEYYESLRGGTQRSATTVVPVLIELFRPQSVVDVGCGLGIWLATFRQHGVAEVLGIDGSWVPREQREIPDAQFYEHDLCEPLRLDRRFDLALCLEVAEHLPPESARPLVESLTRLAPVVVFSAAIPFQGGDGHVNERWPSFWSDLFAACGFGCLDGLRDRFWMNDAVDVWYRQNMLCYVADDRIDLVRHSVGASRSPSGRPFDIVHPNHYLRLVRENEQWRRYAESLEDRSYRSEAELTRITNSRVWRFYQAVRPAVNTAKRINAYLRIGS